MAVIVVSDTSPLSGLAIAGYLSLLQQLYGQVVIPVAVADELKRGGQDDPRITAALAPDWVEVRQPQDLTLVEALQAQGKRKKKCAEVWYVAVKIIDS
jgi:predicted nucleic acid-binding protein